MSEIVTMRNLESLSAGLERQSAIEEESISSGITAYRERTSRLEAHGLQSLTDYGKRLLARSIEPMVEGIVQFVTEAYTAPGRHNIAVKYIELVEPEVIAFITARCIYDGVGQQRNYQNVALEIANRFEDEMRFRSFESQNKSLFNAVLRNLEKHPIGYQARVRRSMLARTMKKFEIAWAKWQKTDKFHLGSKLIDLFITHVGLVKIVERHNKRGAMNFLQATDELNDWIQKSKASSEILSPRFLPMVCPPKPWTTPTDGGYYDKRLKAKLVKSPNKGYQQELRYREMPTVYAAVNALQETPWKINPAMHTIVKELWEAGVEVKGFPPRLDHPIPAKPADIDTNKESRRVWKKQAGDTFRANLRAGSKRMQTAKILFIADKFLEEKAVWFPVQLDFRGRIYTMPQYLNPQGCDLAKSLLTFAEGKPLGEKGAWWLFIHAANCFGYDKCSLQERYEWTKENLSRIESTANDPLSDKWWMEADKPFQFLAAAIEILGYLNDGGEDYVCSLPIMVDGSCNGLQHFSAMLRDETCGSHVNLVPLDKPSDIYQAVADAVKDFLKQEDRPEFTTYAYLWIQYGVNRKLCKRPVMVLPYGGTHEAVRQYVLEATMERTIESHDPHPFGEELIKACNYLSGVVWDCMKTVVKGPRVAMDWLQKVARCMSKEGLRINWTTPTGFWVQQAYPCTKARRVETKIGDKIVKMTVREELLNKLDSRKQGQAVSPNFVHSLDAAALALTIVSSVGQGVHNFAAIHDSYGTLAADMPILLDTLREEFVRMYEAHDVLAEFRTELGAALPESKALPPLPARGSLELAGVLKSDFFFA